MGVATIFSGLRTILQIALPPLSPPPQKKEKKNSLIKDLVTL